METRATKKRANTAKLVTVPKRHRVVLEEFPDIPNLNVPADLTPLQCRKNPKLNKSTTKKPIANCDEPYIPDILIYLHEMEMQKKRRPMVNYIESVQGDVTVLMRGILVDWLVEVAEEYKLLPHTLHLSVSYIDRFLSLQSVPKSELQLLGVSSMLIASKYEEITPPMAVDFSQITNEQYNVAEVVEMEADILESLKFELGSPTASTFLKRFAEIASGNRKTSNLQLEYLSNYLAELSLLEYDCIRFLPSAVAASAIFLARFIISPNVHPWTSSLSECSGYKSFELKECVCILHDLYLSRRAPSFRAVREKYKQQKFKYVADLPSPPEVPCHYFEEQ